ncbi:GspE/PulE family protein [Haloimpatiens sp. FM7330]|uniref:GspE/PulE family protein n=1 Tax=Haloimpatiens sp. FM7330 TaxID=3298610 RepID=UPI003632438A
MEGGIKLKHMSNLIKNSSYVDLNSYDINMDVVKKISREMANKLGVFPFDIKDNKVCVASSKTINEDIINYIKFIYQKDVRVYIVEPYKIKSYMDKYYENQSFNKAVKELEMEKQTNYMSTLSDKYKQNIKTAPAVKIVNFIINEAIKMNASDIHIEPLKDIVLIRFRIDGILIKFTEITKNIFEFICKRIKIISNMDISKIFIPGDGKILYDLNNKKYDIRVSTLPTINGEKIVLRILHKNCCNSSLNSLGYNNKNYETIKKCIKYSKGMILVTGPTGCGKSTTLYAMLNELDKQENNITTIEDPVEYDMPYINQVNVNKKAGLTFATGLRSILRQDPDVIMLGEIRDRETAEIAVKSAMTGHLVLSTLHTKDAVSSILRLMNMGVENYLIADTLVAVIAQRLVRKICPNCKKKYIPNDYEKKKINLCEGEFLYKGTGCDKCNNTGYSGRTVVCEVMVVDEKLKEFIRDMKDTKLLKKYIKDQGMISLIDNGLELVRKGVTTYEEVLKSVN